MELSELIDILINLPSPALFIWLYFRERSRASELSDEKFQAVVDCIDRIESRANQETDPPTLSAKDLPWD